MSDGSKFKPRVMNAKADCFFEGFTIGAATGIAGNGLAYGLNGLGSLATTGAWRTASYFDLPAMGYTTLAAGLIGGGIGLVGAQSGGICPNVPNLGQ